MRVRILLAMCACVAASGCAVFTPSDEGDAGACSPLRPVTPSVDSVAVEIFLARMPADDTVCEELWRQIDEQQVPEHVRRELARNGFRVGVVGGTVPDELARVLQIKASLAEPNVVADDSGELEDSSSTANTPSIVDLADDRAITRQWRRFRPGKRAEINVSDIYPTLPVLLNDANGLGGRTFEQAQAVYAIRVNPRPRHQVAFEVTPELHHGRPKTHYTAGEGPYWRMDSARDREVYEKLRIPLTLLPGQMLVLGSDAISEGSLGYHFHRISKAKGAGRRLVVIRLAESPEL